MQLHSCATGDRYPEPKSFHGINSLSMVSLSHTHYRISLRRPFARGAYPAGGAYWPDGPTGLKVGAMAPVTLPLATPLSTNRVRWAI